MSKKKDKTPKVVNKKKSYSPSMLKTYRDVVVPNMVSKFNYENCYYRSDCRNTCYPSVSRNS